MIALIDYGAGNLRSVQNALARLNQDCRVCSSSSDLSGADAILFPGVGAAGPAMASLRQRGLDRAIVDAIRRDVPYLGICLGLQLLFESSAEDGARCLGVLNGSVERLRTSEKLPHVGWNTVEQTRSHALVQGIDGRAMYFTHSFVGVPDDDTVVIARTVHGSPFVSVLAFGNAIAVQFHPERSGPAGLQFLGSFVAAARLAA